MFLVNKSRYKFVVALVLIALSAVLPSYAFAYDHPGGFHTRAQLEHTRQQVLNGEEPWRSSWSLLLEQAEKGLDEVPSAMADFYMCSQYTCEQGDNKKLLVADTEAAYATALAYAIGADLSQAQRERYADKAVAILNDWAYTNTAFSGNSGALLLTYTATGLIYSAELLWNYPGWSEQDKTQFKRWAKDVLYRAAQIKLRKFPDDPNNWNDWGILMALSIDHLLDDEPAMAEDTDLLRQLIDIQIRADGGLPTELARGDRSAYYTKFALEPLTAAIEVLRNSGGPDLYAWQPPSGGTVKDALEFFSYYWVEDPNRWPSGPQVIDAATIDVLVPMGKVYGDDVWFESDTPRFKGGTGLGWLMPTLMQPLPHGSAVAEAPPPAPQRLRLIKPSL